MHITNNQIIIFDLLKHLMEIYYDHETITRLFLIHFDKIYLN